MLNNNAFPSTGFQPTAVGFAPATFVPGHALAGPPELGQSLIEDILKGAWGPWGDVAFRGITGTALVALAAVLEMPGLIQAVLYLTGGLWLLQAISIALQEMRAPETIEV